MIKNIVFDVGEVLVDFRWQGYMKDLNFPEDVIQYLGEKVVYNPLWNELDRGLIPREEIITKMKACVPEYDAEVTLFFDKIENIVITRSYSKPWLKELRERGYKVYLLSNYPGDLFDLHEKTRFDFIDEIDGKIVSGHVKMIKPEPEIYQCLFDKYNLKPEECVFLDDRQVNIDAAQKAGMQGILFTSYEEARSNLETLLEHN